MKDCLPKKCHRKECGVVNLESSEDLGSHWIGYYRSNSDRYYFDSYGESPPSEIIDYLKTETEIEKGLATIKQSAVTVQKDNTAECGSLCLYVLHGLSIGQKFEDILQSLLDRYNSSSTKLIIQK